MLAFSSVWTPVFEIAQCNIYGIPSLVATYTSTWWLQQSTTTEIRTRNPLLSQVQCQQVSLLYHKQLMTEWETESCFRRSLCVPLLHISGLGSLLPKWCQTILGGKAVGTWNWARTFLCCCGLTRERDVALRHYRNVIRFEILTVVKIIWCDVV
jgi:hypothetical protein